MIFEEENAMKNKLTDVAEELAREHRKADPDITNVFQAENENEIRLVEITGSVGTTRMIVPFHFGKRPDLGIPYPSAVIHLSPEEFALLKKGNLELPAGWGTFENLTPVYPNRIKTDHQRSETRNGQKRRRVG